MPVTLTRALAERQRAQAQDLCVMLLGYGVGLSWASAVVQLDAHTVLMHGESAPAESSLEPLHETAP